MASKQSQAVRSLYTDWLAIPAQDPDWTPQDQARLMASWETMTSEPGGIDYLQTDAGGVPALWVMPHGAAEDRVLLCIHGGGFISGSMFTHRKMFGHLAKAVGARALLPNYSLLPDGVHPIPLEQTFAVYRWLLEQGIRADRIAITGDSAGGGMTVAVQLRARDEGLPLPAASMPLSPWVDMTGSGESMRSNEDTDALFNIPWVGQLSAGFLAGTDPTDPYASPLHADLTGLPPMYIQVGGHEMPLDDARRLAEHAQQAGLDTRVDVFPEQQHTFQMMAGYAPEADDAIQRLADWVRPKLDLT